MKNLSRRHLIRTGLVLGGGMASVALAACGETTTVERTVIQEVPVERIVTVEKEVPVEIEVIKVVEAAPAKPKDVTLEFTFWATLEDLGTWQQGLDDAKVALPHVSIDWQNVPWGEYWTKLQTRAAAGTVPDVAGMVTLFSQQYIRQDSLIPLDDFAKRDNNDLEDFWPVNLAGYKDVAGRTYGLPYDLSTYLLYVNEDILENAGTELPADGTYSWDVFVETVRKTTARDGDRVETFGSLMLPAADHRLQAFLATNLGGYLTLDGTKSALDTPESIEVIQAWADLRLVEELLPSPDQQVDTPLWETGKATFRFGNPSGVQTMRERVGSPHGGGRFSWDLAFLPVWVEHANELAGGGFSIMKGTEFIEEAWQFIDLYSSGAYLRQMVGTPSRGICGRQSCARSMLNPDNPRNQQFFLDNLNFSYQWALPDYNKIVAITQKYLDQIFLGQITAEEGLTAAAAEQNPIIEAGGAAVVSR